MELNPQFELNKYGIDITDIKTEAEQLIKQSNEAKKVRGCLLLKLPAVGLNKLKPDLFPKCYLVNCGLKANYVFCLQTPI